MGEIELALRAQRHIPEEKVQRVFLAVSITALIAAFFQIVLGGVVRTTGSGLGCPDWPLCHGNIIPPFESAALIEYSHRLSASVLGILVLSSAVLAWCFYRSNRLVLASTISGLVLVIIAAVLGAVTVWTDLTWWVRLFHLATAEWVVACMVITSLLSLKTSDRSVTHQQGDRRTSLFNLLVLASVIGGFVVIVSGSYMVGQGAGSSCANWPLCRDSLLPNGTAYTIHMIHRFLTAIVGVLIATTAAWAWNRRVDQPEIAGVGILTAAAFSIQVITGALTVWGGFSTEMKTVHLGLATLVWIALVALATLAYIPQWPDPKGMEARAQRASQRKGKTL